MDLSGARYFVPRAYFKKKAARSTSKSVEDTGDTRKIFVLNIKAVDESDSARILVGCKPINQSPLCSRL